MYHKAYIKAANRCLKSMNDNCAAESDVWVNINSMYRSPRVWPRLRACEWSTCRSDDWWTLLRVAVSTQEVCTGWLDDVCRVSVCQRKSTSSRHLWPKLSFSPSPFPSLFLPSFPPSTRPPQTSDLKSRSRRRWWRILWKCFRELLAK